MNRALYLGTFDPITLGQLDILERANKFADCLIIGVANLPEATISVENRIQLVEKSVSHLEHVEVVYYDGHFDKMIEKYQVNILIRGLRMMSDFEKELNMVHTNYNLNYPIDTVFLSTNEAYSNYSASKIRYIAKCHGDIDQFLPESIIDDVKSIYA